MFTSHEMKLMKLRRTSFNRFATLGVNGQFILSEAEWLEDSNIDFLLQLESVYLKNFELPFLIGSHQLGVVESDMYETWFKGYMQLICRWLANPRCHGVITPQQVPTLHTLFAFLFLSLLR